MHFLSPSSKNKKKILPEKNPLHFQISCSNIKKFLIFSRKKAFVAFRKTETPKPNFLLFQEVTFQAQKLKQNILRKFLIFREIELSSHKKLFDTLNKTPLGETGCLSTFYYLLAAQASSFLIHSPISTHCAVFV